MENLKLLDGLQMALFGMLSFQEPQVAILDLLQVRILSIIVEEALETVNLFLLLLSDCFLLCYCFLGHWFLGLCCAWIGLKIAAKSILEHLKGILSLNRPSHVL